MRDAESMDQLAQRKSRTLSVGATVWVFCTSWVRGLVIAKLRAVDGTREAMIRLTTGGGRVRTVRRALVELLPIEVFDRDQDAGGGKVEAIAYAHDWWSAHGGVP